LTAAERANYRRALKAPKNNSETIHMRKNNSKVTKTMCNKTPEESGT
jgi:hypothetical protein